MIWFHSESDGTWWLKGIESGCKWEWPSSPLHLYWCPIWLWIEGGKPQASFLSHSWRENSGDRGTIPARIHWASFGQFTRYSCNFPLSHLPSWPPWMTIPLESFLSKSIHFFFKKKTGGHSIHILLELALFTILWTAFHVSLYRSAYFLKVEAFSLLWLSII